MIRCQPALGTYVEMKLFDPSNTSDQLVLATNKAFQEIRRIENLMSVYNYKSDLSRINQGLAMNSPMKIDVELWDLLELCKEIHHLSNGVFDVSATNSLFEQGLRPHHLRISSPSFGGLQDLELIEGGQVRTHQPIFLDLGGIAKGYAIDCAVQQLMANGIEGGVVNAGGDLRVFGNKSQSIYRYGSEDINQPIYLGELAAGAIATSGNHQVRKNYPKSTGHLIDPHSQKSIKGMDSYTVVAQRCVHADALTKVLAVTKKPDLPIFNHYDAIALD